MPETFEKQHYGYAEWSRGLFSEIVTVKGPGTLLFLSGIGGEDSDEKAGTIMHRGNVYDQARLAFEKATRVLAKHGATLTDVVKITAYLLDTREFPNYHRARSEAFRNSPTIPAHTLLAVSGLAWPGMLMEIDITAVIGAQ
jgi:2-iminobutanoate/2-iminopropanoate deaminase